MAAEPVESPEPSLEPLNWDGSSSIAVNDVIEYTCKGGMKFANDFHLDSIAATLLPGLVWDEPEWIPCVESESSIVAVSEE